MELMHWLREFKIKLLVEKNILHNEGKPQCFRKWTQILNAWGKVLLAKAHSASNFTLGINPGMSLFNP